MTPHKFHTSPGRYGRTNYFVDGVPVTREEYYRRLAELPPAENTGLARPPVHAHAWPMRMEAAAVHPSQVAEANAAAAAAGLSVRYDRQGVPEIPNRQVRKEFLKFRGFFDRDGGYGDG